MKNTLITLLLIATMTAIIFTGAYAYGQELNEQEITQCEYLTEMFPTAEFRVSDTTNRCMMILDSGREFDADKLTR